MRPPIRLALCTLAASPFSLSAQKIDYHRADLIRTAGQYVLGATVRPTWLEDSVRFWYTSTGKTDRGVIYLVDPAHAARRVFFDNARLAAVLSLTADTIIDPTRFPTFTAVDTGKAIELQLHKKVFRCDPAAYSCQAVDSADWAWRATLKSGPTWANRSPDKRWDVFSWGNNVYMRPTALSDSEATALRDSVHQGLKRDTTGGRGNAGRGGRGGRGGGGAGRGGAAAGQDSLPLPRGSIQLTTDGVRLFAYGSTNRDVAADTAKPRPTRVTIAWAPDSKKFTIGREDFRGTRIYPMYSSTRDQPVDHSYHYAVPSDSIVPTQVMHVIDVDARTNLRAQTTPTPSTTVTLEPHWNKTSDHFFMLNANRGPSRISAMLVDAKTCDSKSVVRDSTATWVELSHTFGQQNWAVVNGGEDIVWFSERDGWAHLYRFGADGTLKNQIESGPYAVNQLLRVDSVTKDVYFTAWGKAPGFVYYSHLFRVHLDGSGTTALTPEEGDHSVVFAPKGPYFIDTYSPVDKPPVILLRSATDGRVIMELGRGDAELLVAVGWRPPEIIQVKARDGVTDIWGLMYKPSDFDPKKSYPILDHIYPGPQQGSVTRWGFSGTGEEQGLAELGFIIVEIEHQGSTRRSKAFHDFYYRNMGDNGIPDHIAAIRQLAARNPWIDINRVGIYGHSGGGLASTDAILRYPDFYKVAVSGSGNHNPDTYAWYWAGRYQGPYEKASYDSAANYTLARNLKGHLLLMHGDMDNNVHVANTLRVVDALIKANKTNFDMILIPDSGHGLPVYTIRKRWDYLVKYLLGMEPPADYEMLTPPPPPGGGRGGGG